MEPFIYALPAREWTGGNQLGLKVNTLDIITDFMKKLGCPIAKEWLDQLYNPLRRVRVPAYSRQALVYVNDVLCPAKLSISNTCEKNKGGKGVQLTITAAKATPPFWEFVKKAIGKSVHFICEPRPTNDHSVFRIYAEPEVRVSRHDANLKEYLQREPEARTVGFCNDIKAFLYVLGNEETKKTVYSPEFWSYSIVPDAFRIDVKTRTITAVEVEDTNSMSWSKRARYTELYRLFSKDGCATFKLLTINANSVCSYANLDMEFFDIKKIGM